MGRLLRQGGLRIEARCYVPAVTLFRPCIDLHDGQVKQIVGGTLRDDGAGPTENFVAEQGAGHFADLYRGDGLEGAHVIRLGPGTHHHVSDHVLGFVVETAGLLDACTAIPAHIDFSAGQRG